AQVLDDLPALAWSDPGNKDTIHDIEAAPKIEISYQAVVFGSDLVAEALTEEGDWAGGASYDCERTDNVASAIRLAGPPAPHLGERLADEVRHALVTSVDSAARGVRVPLGEGTEVLGAIWGAIARIREVITLRADGSVRFPGRGPEGAAMLAPWMHSDVSRGD